MADNLLRPTTLALTDPVGALDVDQNPALPGSQREQEKATAEAQRDLLGNVVAGAKDTALGSAVRLITDEAPAINEQHPDSPLDVRIYSGLATLLGARAGPAADYSDHYTTLTEGIPSRFHEEILDEPNKEAAGRARARVLDQLNRQQINGMQQGLSPSLAMLAGSIVDVDAPLMLVTGGGYKAALVARQALRAAQKVGLGARGALRASSAAVGASSGLQAGALVGAVQAATQETADWTLVAESALQTMLLGAAANPLLRGDVKLSARVAQDELHQRMAKNDPNLDAAPAVDPANAERLSADDQGPVLFEVGDVESTVGARQVQPIPGASTTPMDAGSTDALKDIGAMADNWRHDSDWQSQKVADDDTWWAQVAMHGLFNVTTSNFRALYKSDSSVLNWMLGNVFESPNGLGRGRYTAAAGMEMYHRRMTQQFTQPVQEATKDWATRTGNNNATGTPSQAGMRTFNRDVMLELNDRALGRTSVRDPAIGKAADAYEAAGVESVNIGRGEAGQLSVDGFDGLPSKRGYTPYVWRGDAILRLEKAGVITRRSVIDAMATAYRQAGMAAGKDAEAVAEAVVARAIAQDTDIDTNLVSMLSGDGREFISDALARNGMSQVELEAVMQRLTGKTEEAGKESFAKSRNDIDMGTNIATSDGSDVRIVDLMEQDLHGVWQRYARRMAGSASLARVGITNRAQRKQFIQAAQSQQRALGEDVMDAGLIDAMFSHFNGGPVAGYSLWGKQTNVGIDPAVALVKRMTNLSLLGKVSFAQAGETGAQIAAVGLQNWMRRGPFALADAELKAGNKRLLDDLSFITGELGKDQHLFAEHLDLDDMHATDSGQLISSMTRLSQKATYIQSFVSGFNLVRGVQQQVSAMAITDKVFLNIRQAINNGTALDPTFAARMQTDLGLGATELAELEDLIHRGLIEFNDHAKGTFVNRINADQWPADLRLTFGAAVTRNQNQIVQRSMAGEQDAWLSTTAGSVLTHLKTFPMQAVQKQFMRNIRHTDIQSANTVMMGMATAALAISVKDAIDGKERSASELARTAFGYSNITGWMPMYIDPTMSFLGMDDYRFNQYGRHADYTPASITWLNRASRLGGASVKAVTGQADYDDKQSLKALPWANLVGMSRLFQ